HTEPFTINMSDRTNSRTAAGSSRYAPATVLTTATTPIPARRTRPIYFPLRELRDSGSSAGCIRLHSSLHVTAQPLPWRKEITRDQWRAFFAAYLGWLLDGFDFTIITFLLVDISRSFTVSQALAGALGTVTLIFRLVGGVGAGTAADRWGRKGPL